MCHHLRISVLVMALLGACGDQGPRTIIGNPGSYARLPLLREGAPPHGEVRVVASFAPADKSLGDWIAEAQDHAYLAIRATDADQREARERGQRAPRVPSAYLVGEGPKRLRVPCPPTTGPFNQVIVHLRNYGGQPEMIRVVLRNAGENLAKSEWVSFISRGGLRPFPFDFPQLRALDHAPDEVVFEAKGDVKAIAVTRIELIQLPLERFLPASQGLGELMAMGDDDRRAVGISSLNPMRTEFRVPDSGELCFSYGTVRLLHLPGSRSKLKVRLSTEGVDALERTFPIVYRQRARNGWREASLDLSRFAGHRVTARFELETAGEQEAFGALAELAVCQRGDQASTVLLVTSDTHRGDHIGGISPDPESRLVATPQLDALAGRGVLYSNAYASTNVTNPSHVALMTGISPRDTRILNNTTPLIDHATTLAEQFGAQGYRTMAITSAYHLLHSESGLGQGFGRLNGPRKNHRDGALSVEVLSGWLEQAAGQPLFVWLHLFDAHSPYAPPQPYDSRYWKGPVPLPGEGRQEQQTNDNLPLPKRVIPAFLEGLTDTEFPYQQYRGEVDYVDELMGRVLGLDRMRDAIIAFTSDHGESFGEHGVWWDHADLYPETVHVPLILSWPGSPRGVHIDEPVRQIDIGRTLLNLTDLEVVEFPGRDLRWALDEFPAADALFEISAHGNVAAIQSGGWRLIVHLRKHHEHAIVEPRAKHSVELYHMSEDQGCLIDLVRESAHFERAKTMRAHLLGWLNDADPTGLAGSKVMTMTALDSLKALGYLGDETGAPPAGALYEEDAQDDWCQFFAR